MASRKPVRRHWIPALTKIRLVAARESDSGDESLMSKSRSCSPLQRRDLQPEELEQVFIEVGIHLSAFSVCRDGTDVHTPPRSARPAMRRPIGVYQGRRAKWRGGRRDDRNLVFWRLERRGGEAFMQSPYRRSDPVGSAPGNAERYAIEGPAAGETVSVKAGKGRCGCLATVHDVYVGAIEP